MGLAVRGQDEICVRKKPPVVPLLERTSAHNLAFFSRISNKKLLAADIFVVLQLNMLLFFQLQCFKPSHITTVHVPFWSATQTSICVVKSTQIAHF